MNNDWKKKVVRNAKMMTPARRLIKRFAYWGNRRYCPVCDRSARIFLGFGVVARPNARCPFCNSLERHRALWRFLHEKTDLFQHSDRRMLHIAPESCFEPRFREQIGAGYLTADLMEPADVKMDITNIQYPDETFDIVYCSHVLEHVPDDRGAMREMCRVLRRDGWAIMMVPITVDQTIEDPSITDPAERLRLFGQDDHVRRYGPDFVDRLQEAGFTVTTNRPEDFLSQAEIERIAATPEYAGEIYFCTKDLATGQ